MMQVIARGYIVAGRVQGVGFRNYTQKKARVLGIKGWVKNLADGRVEARAMAAEEQMAQFERFLRRGPMLAEVSEVEKFEVEVEKLAEMSQGSEEFQILWE